MRTPTITAALLACAVAGLGACATSARVDTSDPQLVRASAAEPGVAANAAGFDHARPPKGCRGGSDGGRNADWVLEYRRGGSRLLAKGWATSWREWVSAVEMQPRGQAPVACRIRVASNSALWLEFRRDGHVISSDRLVYQTPCVYAYQDAKDNLVLFYKKR